MRGRTTVSAIHEQQMEQVLRELGLLDQLLLGQIGCVGCGKKLTLDDVGGILVGPPHRLVCSSLECLGSAERGS